MHVRPECMLSEVNHTPTAEETQVMRLVLSGELLRVRQRRHILIEHADPFNMSRGRG